MRRKWIISSSVGTAVLLTAAIWIGFSGAKPEAAVQPEENGGKAADSALPIKQVVLFNTGVGDRAEAARGECERRRHAQDRRAGPEFHRAIGVCDARRGADQPVSALPSYAEEFEPQRHRILRDSKQ